MIQLFGIGTCTTVRKELKAFREAGKEVDFIDYLKSGLSVEVLKELLDAYSWEQIINRKSLALRNLDADTRAFLLSLKGKDFDEKAYEILKDNVRVLKRPLVKIDGKFRPL